jgi:tryptophanyl-tRNA synthetase
MSMRKRVLSGIRATGRLHLGNYLGAVSGMLELQADTRYEPIYMVADAHTLTTPFDPDELRQHRREVFIDYLAAGLDPEQSILFLQADVCEHFEFAFYCAMVTTVARMQHLPTFKDKIKQHPDHATLALLNYPALMSADILLYRTHLVPVGIDQEPHIEIAREIARKLNATYGLDLPEPQRFATEGEYVPSLTGAGKMSKSVAGSAIDLVDSPEEVRKKIAAAPTDSGRGALVPTEGGVANLLTLVGLFLGAERKAAYERAYTTTGLQYGELKTELADAIVAFLQPYQERRAILAAQPEKIDDYIAAGAEKARAIAQETLLELKAKLGLK